MITIHERLESTVVAAVVIFGATEVVHAQSAAEKAVEAAKAYSGITLNVLYEAGLQPLDPINFSGPLWEELTGIKVNIVEAPIDQIFTKTMQAHKAGSGAYDILNVIPNQMPDLAFAGALEPLDAFVEKYGYQDELNSIAPVYRDNWMKVEDKIYGLPDDGDALILYYRKDVFDDPDNQAAFKEKHGYDLAPPNTWAEFSDIGQFITDTFGPEMYGAGMLRQPGNAQYMFQERFRVEGGEFFDRDSMDATINSDVGIQVLEGMRAENAFMPPGVEQ